MIMMNCRHIDARKVLVQFLHARLTGHSILLVIMSIFVVTLPAVAQTIQKPMTVDDLLQVQRVGNPQLSPNGAWVAYTIGATDRTANRVVTQIYLVSSAGGEPRQLTGGLRSAVMPRWSPDGKRIAYLSGGQIWTLDLQTGDLEQVTNISSGIYFPLVWSPDGRFIAFASDVYPECPSDDCNRERDEREEKSKVKAHIVTNRLLFRHWDEWRDTKRTHVFIVSASGGPARDLTPGDFDSPPFAAATGVDFAFAPDGKEIAFLRNPDKREATSTNSDIFVTPVGGGSAKNITSKNRGYDVAPIYTLDGKYIVYRSQATPGFDSDRWRLMAYSRATGASVEITRNFDLQVEEVALSPDGSHVYFTAGARGRMPVYRVSLGGSEPRKVLADVFATNLQVTPDGKSLIFISSSMAAPPEVYRAELNGGRLSALTSSNKGLMAGLELGRGEEKEWTGAAGAKIHGFLVKPANFDASKKYPLLVLLHGGPQVAWTDSWSYRWNPQIFASSGYLVFMPNHRGSAGYGQRFVNEVSGDWPGKAYTDIMNGVAVLLDEGIVDPEYIGAAGASYGGYMVNWLEGHNSDSRFSFKALVSHAGVFNLTSLYGTTDELWFVEWEFKGTPWSNPEQYARWSPNMFVKNFKTPLLVIHGELDYRTPIDQALQLFTALQKMGVDSKLLVFPDEGHWVLKPQNSALWYTTVIDWFDQHLKAKTSAAPVSDQTKTHN